MHTRGAVSYTHLDVYKRQLVKACLDHEYFVIAEADAQFFSSNDGLNLSLIHI